MLDSVEARRSSAARLRYTRDSPPPTDLLPTEQPVERESFINTSAILGIPPAAMVSARPSDDQEVRDHAMLVQQQLEAFGVSEVMAPDSGATFQHGYFDIQDIPSTVPLPLLVPTQGLLQCCVRRNLESFVVFGGKSFHMTLQRGQQHIMSGQKRPNKPTPNYSISTNPDDIRRESRFFHGKVRSNFAGTDFTIYDNGLSPEESTRPEDVRCEIGAVVYGVDASGTSGPRRFVAVLPNREGGGALTQWRPCNEQETLIATFRSNPKDPRLTVLEAKAPGWNEHLRSYQLDFRGRVKMTSVKNMQLVDPAKPNRVVLQFGKSATDTFILDFQAPLNATQAFGIALTTFESRLGS